jgi:uncharacterized membrane protein YgaE (UPF0421/DUF939 family)
VGHLDATDHVGMGQALRRVAAEAWPLLHSAAAATVAWALARHLIHHHQPFFAPIAAAAALNAALGERGLNAVRLLLGVAIGILVGEVAIVFLGDSYLAMGLGSFLAMAVAVAMGGARIVIAEAAGSAILTIALASGEAGTQRLEDAALGAAVALVFSQLLFAPEPVALVRRAAAAALSEMATGVRQTADMLERDDNAPGEQALDRLRELRDHFSELTRTRRVSPRVARMSAAWQARLKHVVRENENAGYLDLLGGSCLLLARSALAVDRRHRPRFAPGVRQLSHALAALAARPGDRDTRRQAIDEAAGATRSIEHLDAPPGSARAAAVVAVRMVATDITVYASGGNTTLG